jgi:predicted nucleic acid-binding protein
MIVLDASIVVEFLMNRPAAQPLRAVLAQIDEPCIVPHLLDVEVANALRNLTVGRQLDQHRTRQLLAQLTQLPATRYSHIPLLGRIWELRHNFTAYDAAYIALAEATNSVLYTTDEKLSRGHRARVALLTR